MSYFLGIDLGGTVIKAGIYSASGQELAVAEHYAQILTPQPGFAERDMTELWRAVCQVIQQSLHQSQLSATAIQGVSFSSHGKGLYALDQHGQPVRNGIISSDTRALSLVSDWQHHGMDKQTYARGLQQLWTGHPAVILRWLKQHEPEHYQQISAVLMVHDYIRYCLTGEIAAEITNISGSNLYNPHSHAYDPMLMNQFGIDEVKDKTAPVIGSSQQAGVVTHKAAVQCGLQAGTPVYGGLFDVVASALCSGVSDERTLSAVAGTWSIATCVMDSIPATEYPYVWGDYCIPGKYFVHEGSPTSASNLAWFIRHFAGNDHHCYQQFDTWVAERYGKPANIVFLPYLYGSNLQLNLSGSFIGLQAHHEMVDLVYAIYQGIVFSHLIHQDRILALNPAVERIRMTGGPTHSAIWMQMFADASNLPVEVIDIQQSGCRAAAICAAVGRGYYANFAEAIAATQPDVTTFLPDNSKHHYLREQMKRYLRVANALSGVDDEQ